VRQQIHRVDLHREVLPRQRRLFELGHTERHVAQAHRAAHFVPLAGFEPVLERCVELALQRAPADVGDVETRAAQRQTVRHDVGLQTEPLLQHSIPRVEPQRRLVEGDVQMNRRRLTVEPWPQGDVTDLDLFYIHLQRLGILDLEVAKEQRAAAQDEAVDAEAPSRFRLRRSRYRGRLGRLLAHRNQRQQIDLAVRQTIERDVWRVQHHLAQLNCLAEQRQPAQLDRESLPRDERLITLWSEFTCCRGRRQRGGWRRRRGWIGGNGRRRRRLRRRLR
jgi:hypothetical protein